MVLIEPKMADFSALLSLAGSIVFGCSNGMRVDGTKPKQINVERNGDQP